MSFRLSHIHEYNRFIAIDLGSYRIRASIYEIENGVLVEKWKASIRQNRKNFLDGAITNLQWVASSIEQAIIQASQHLEEIPNDVILAFSPEICIFDSITTQYIRADQDSTLTMQEIDSMIQKIEHHSLERAKEKSKMQYGVVHDDIRLVSSTLTAIYIDGKRVTNPIGFTGWQVRIQVLNVFVPASEFNILRSIVANLGKNTISLVPMPLIFPKVIENTEYSNENNVYIDIGYTHTTVVFESKNEIIAFETFPLWTRSLIDSFSLHHPRLSLIEVEHILFQKKIESSENDLRNQVTKEFASYIIDSVLGLLEQEKNGFIVKNFFYSGALFHTDSIVQQFSKQLEMSYDYSFRFLPLGNGDTEKNSDYSICFGLSLLAQELLVLKKDPVIRILRYVLYHYD